MQGYDVASALLQKNQAKKRKRYVLHLFTRRSDINNVRTVETAAQSVLKDFTLIHLEDPEEALKLVLIKNIDGIVIDPDFLGDIGMTVEYAFEIKQRKKVPLLFLCEKEEQLIGEYRKRMFEYEEADDYVLTPLDFSDVCKRLRKMVQANARSAKRYNFATDVEVQRLNSFAWEKADLSDLSLVGAGMVLKSESPVSRGEQMQIKIPLRKFNRFHPEYGDYLKLAMVVRRVSIDGKNIGGSFEYLTPMQQAELSELMSVLERRQRAAEKKRPGTVSLQSSNAAPPPQAG
jgi:DNA-binding response OmpR family regulator